MKILVVDDDPILTMEIREGLEAAGFFPEVCRDGARAWRVASSGSFAAILLDWNLPSLDGLSICRQLRESNVETPILMMSGRSMTGDRVKGLSEGADDYLAKPFDFNELLARVRALVRRDRIHRQAVIRIDDLVVDTIQRTAFRGGKPLGLTPREFALLETLAADEGRILTRKDLLRRVWLDERAASNVVDVSIRNLRKKLDDGYETSLIFTAHGQGYMLRGDDDGG